jgi:hypothetical protein
VGSHSVLYRSTDLAGNVEAWKTIAFTIASGTNAPGITVNPSSGSGSSHTFVFTYSMANLEQEHLLFNSSLNGVGACYLYYDQSSQKLYLANDQGTAFNQSAAPNTSATLSNSQCSVPMSAASVSISGNSTTITLTINFTASFAGAENIYVNTVNTSGVAGTAQQIGTWTVTAPTNSITVSPSSGSGYTKTFVFTYSITNLAQEHLLFNSSLNPVGACYLYYDQPSQMLYMANDQASAFSQSAAPSSSTTLSNSQCTIPMSAVSVSISGNTTTITLMIDFSAVFAGAKNIYVNTVNTSGVAGTAQQIGSWSVTAPADNTITVNPSSGSGSTQTFVFTYTMANLAQEHLLFNSSLNPVGACYLYYDQPSQKLYLANDQGTAFSQSATPGTSVTLSNSQCSLPMSSAWVSISGNTTTIILSANFSASFTGAKNIYVNTVNTSGVAGTAQQIGTWTP